MLFKNKMEWLLRNVKENKWSFSPGGWLQVLMKGNNKGSKRIEMLTDKKINEVKKCNLIA